MITEDAVVPAVEAMNVQSFGDLDYYHTSERSSWSVQDPFKCLELEFSLLSANTSFMNVKLDEVSGLCTGENLDVAALNGYYFEVCQ